jgi:cytochrome c-type biogenesis protein CcmE
MFGKKVKPRFNFLVILLALTTLALFIIFKSLEKNIVYFLSPTEIYEKEDILFKEKIRIGGLVKKNSVVKYETSTRFIITDLKNELVVSYNGLLPNLFSEEKGVIAEGLLRDKKYFIAYKILAKHDENYMPPEVKKILENSSN